MSLPHREKSNQKREDWSIGIVVSLCVSGRCKIDGPLQIAVAAEGLVDNL